MPSVRGTLCSGTFTSTTSSRGSNGCRSPRHRRGAPPPEALKKAWPSHLANCLATSESTAWSPGRKGVQAKQKSRSLEASSRRSSGAWRRIFQDGKM